MQVSPAGAARWLRRRAWAGSVILLVVAILGLTATGAIFAVQAYAERQEKARRQAILAAARQEALHLTSLSYKTADEDVRRVLQGATGGFKKRFSSQAKGIKQVLDQAKVVSTGTVREAGIASIDQNSATVLLAMGGSVQNAKTPRGSPRQYRFKMTLQHDGGRWLVSRMRIVP